MAKPKELPGAVVGSGEPQFRKPKLPFRNAFGGFKRRFSGLSTHTKVIFLVIVFLLFGGLATVIYTHQKGNPKLSAACSDTVLEHASGSLGPSNTQMLEPIVKQIKSTQDYDQDPNCLNIVVTYYVDISDPTNAQMYLDKLQKVYNPKQGFSTKLGQEVRSLTILQSEVSFLQKAQEDLLKNAQILQSGQTKESAQKRQK